MRRFKDIASTSAVNTLPVPRGQQWLKQITGLVLGVNSSIYRFRGSMRTVSRRNISKNDAQHGEEYMDKASASATRVRTSAAYLKDRNGVQSQ